MTMMRALRTFPLSYDGISFTTIQANAEFDCPEELADGLMAAMHCCPVDAPVEEPKGQTFPGAGTVAQKAMLDEAQRQQEEAAAKAKAAQEAAAQADHDTKAEEHAKGTGALTMPEEHAEAGGEEDDHPQTPKTRTIPKRLTAHHARGRQR